jgi:hypothetical protein
METRRGETAIVFPIRESEWLSFALAGDEAAMPSNIVTHVVFGMLRF